MIRERSPIKTLISFCVCTNLQDTEASQRRRREQQFSSILSVPTEERDRVERALVLDRAAAAIAAANAALEAANEGRRTWSAAARERPTSVPKRSVFLDGGSTEGPLTPLGTSGVLLTKKPAEDLGASRRERGSGGGGGGYSKGGGGGSLTLGEDATPGPDFWSWTPPEGGAGGSRGAETPMLKKAEAPKARPQLDTLVLDRPTSKSQKLAEGWTRLALVLVHFGFHLSCFQSKDVLSRSSPRVCPVNLPKSTRWQRPGSPGSIPAATRVAYRSGNRGVQLMFLSKSCTGLAPSRSASSWLQSPLDLGRNSNTLLVLNSLWRHVESTFLHFTQGIKRPRQHHLPSSDLTPPLFCAGFQTLSLPLQSQSQAESSITSLPPLQSLLDVAIGQEEGERTRQEQELAQAHAEQAIQMPEGLGVLEEATSESGVEADGTRWGRRSMVAFFWDIIRNVPSFNFQKTLVF